MAKEHKNRQPALLDVVALLDARPADNLARGQDGAVVDAPGADSLLVEFSDGEGRDFTLVPCAPSEFLVLHDVPQAA